MNGGDHRKALQNLHNLIDEYEDVSMENEFLSNENKELEKDINFMANKHNENIKALREIADNNREYRIGKSVRRQQVVDHHEEENVCNCDKCVTNHSAHNNECVEEQKNADNFELSQVLKRLSKKINNIKYISIFVIALALVVLLSIGASPTSIVGWEEFTNLYIEFICNPGSMAMSAALVFLLYRSIVKKNK